MQIIAVERQDVEGVERHLGVMLAGVERVEIGDAVDHELLDPVLERGLHDLRVAVGPVVAASGDQPDAVAIALDAEAVDPMQAQRAERCTS